MLPGKSSCCWPAAALAAAAPLECGGVSTLYESIINKSKQLYEYQIAESMKFFVIRIEEIHLIFEKQKTVDFEFTY